MMGWRTKLSGGDEHDAFSRWRRWLCYLSRPGVVRAIKAKHNRRARRQAKEELDRILREGEK